MSLTQKLRRHAARNPVRGKTAAAPKRQRKALTVEIDMGQAYRDALPAHVRKLGGRVWSVRQDSSSTVVTVTATFYKGQTARQVQDLLWDEWPMCSIGVQEVR